MSPRRWTATLLGVVFSTCSAHAQTVSEDEDLALAYGDKDFVSIASGTKQLVHKAPSVATVITAEDIAAMGATTVDEALEAVPGLHVSRATFNYGANYAVRGILAEYNPQVLTLINGIPITSVYLNNRTDIPVSLPIENVARIEVIRGPGSALYGADAVAGAINIITKTASDVSGNSAGVRAGSFNSWDTWFQHGSKTGELETVAYLRLGATDGPRRIIQADAQTAIDPAVSLAPGPTNLGHNDIDGQIEVAYGKLRFRTAYWQRDDIGTGAGIANALDPVGKMRSERFTSDLTWNDPAFTRDLGVTFQAAYMHQTNEITTPLVLFPAGAFGGTFPSGMLGQPSKWEKQLRLSTSAIYTGLNDHRLRFGAGHDQQEIYKVRDVRNYTFVLPGPTPTPLAGGLTDVSATSPFLNPHSRQVNYAYLQDEWSFARDWTLTTGVRYDHFSDFGSTTNPRLALVWDVRSDLTAKIMYGTAFRAPSFVEQFAVNNPVATGNPALKPEKIETLEAALSWQLRRDLRVNLSVFKHELADLIRAIPNATAGTGSTFQNTGRQTGNGGELEAVWDVGPSLRLSGHYAYQKNIDEATKHDAGYAPHHHLYARADWRFAAGWMLDTQLNYVADRERAYGDNRPEVPNYTTVDLTLRSDRPRQGWDFAASIHNLFDADVREPSLSGSGIIYDLPMPRRSFWLQARYSL